MKRFEEELNKLRKYIIDAGDMIIEAFRSSVDALANENLELARKVIDNDRNINKISSKIENKSLKMLLLDHPVATDLREVSSTLKIATDLERIGDQAKDIADLLKFLIDGNSYKDKLGTILEMSKIIEDMLKDTILAYRQKDSVLASEVIETDDKVDKLFHKVRDTMVELIKSGADNSDQAIYLMMIAKYVEKVGDHCENIAKWVYFYSTGDRI